MIAASMLPFLWNVFISLRSGKIAGDDPWEGNTLEWATTSPPPPYNFDRLPRRSAPSARSSTPATRRTPATRSAIDDERLVRGRATPRPAARGRPRRSGGISNPILGMILFICSEVMFFAGLFAAYFNVRNTSPVWPPIASPNSVPVVTPELAERFNLHAEPWFALVLDDPPRHQLVHLPARRVGDPAG